MIPYLLLLPPVEPQPMWVVYCLVFLPAGAQGMGLGVGVLL